MWAACLSLFCFPSSLFCPLFVCCICMCVCPLYVGVSGVDQGACSGSASPVQLRVVSSDSCLRSCILFSHQPALLIPGHGSPPAPDRCSY
ncbi:hypothetical protein J4Q44_G00026050 [Coregonus suidteri]|uniref:Secreted protein n=1 Tax=Coregonus suidteri TaxID=861788 RepID=A0AAN8R4P8_9TELE